MNGDTKLCYICFKTNQSFYDLTSFDTDNISYLDKLQECIHKKLVQAEGSQICEKCLKYLLVSYKFMKAVLKSQNIWVTQLELLKNYLENDGTHIVVTTECMLKLEQLNESNLIKVQENFEENNKQFVENHCEEIFNNVNNDDVWENVSAFSCGKCLEIFKTEVELLDHNCNFTCIPEPDEPKSPTEVNLNTVLDTCNDCDNKDDKSLVVNSSENHETNQEQPKKLRKVKIDVINPCDICGKTFNKRYKLHKHRKSCHPTTIEKKYVCTYCGKSFKQSYHLREHITIHTGERNYSCIYCDKKFQRMSSQRRHIRTHEAPQGQKSKKSPFLCNICGKSFPYSNGAQRHMRTHSGVKRFECNTCNRKFSQTTHLQAHLRTHTGEKPFVCETCGETFSFNVSLQKHLTVHANEPKDNKDNNVLNDIVLLTSVDDVTPIDVYM